MRKTKREKELEEELKDKKDSIYGLVFMLIVFVTLLVIGATKFGNVRDCIDNNGTIEFGGWVNTCHTETKTERIMVEVCSNVTRSNECRFVSEGYTGEIICVRKGFRVDLVTNNQSVMDEWIYNGVCDTSIKTYTSNYDCTPSEVEECKLITQEEYMEKICNEAIKCSKETMLVWERINYD